jgi:DNA-binding NtrC family response regulator
VRLIAATNEDVAAAVATRRFRSDLFFRVNVIPIAVPPLRVREDDVALLARHFAAVFSAKQGRRPPVLSPEAIEQLRAHSWPGNVRELQNCIERAIALTDGAEISALDLPEPAPSVASSSRARSNGALASPLDPAAGALLPLVEIERRHILHVLSAVDGNKRLAARILGLDRRTLYRKLEIYEGMSATSLAASARDGA